MDDRPKPSPQKLRNQFADWERGDELPGRTLANLKTGFLPEVLAELETTSELSAILDIWQQWERGDEGPAVVLDALKAHGLDKLLDELS